MLRRRRCPVTEIEMWLRASSKELRILLPLRLRSCSCLNVSSFLDCSIASVNHAIGIRSHVMQLFVPRGWASHTKERHFPDIQCKIPTAAAESILLFLVKLRLDFGPLALAPGPHIPDLI